MRESSPRQRYVESVLELYRHVPGTRGLRRATRTLTGKLYDRGASRIRVRLNLDFLAPHELQDWLRHALEQAGNPQLMTPELMTTLTEHAAGNLRLLTTMANEMLVAAARQERTTLDQKLYYEVFAPQNKTAATRAKRAHA